jgi:hypothetical protein
MGVIEHMSTQESHGENDHMGQQEEGCRMELKRVPQRKPIQCNRRN